jgi:ATP/maltotriose-dependent transcriptional regulator MalT
VRLTLWRGEMVTQHPTGAQEMPLLRTKLYTPPPRHERVPRPRLIERLDACLGRNGLREGLGFARKLTLISAPAGFGKTTLVSEWVQALGVTASPNAIAWLSLDEGDQRSGPLPDLFDRCLADG